jgi:radical SAM protein with 4Fe4S-binding SPASM domain
MIPVLKESVRIKEEPQGVVFIDVKSGEYILTSFFEAFILSLFDGNKTIKDIVAVLKNLKNAPDEREIQNDINMLIQNKCIFIEFIKSPLKKGRTQVDPYNFLLRPDIFKRPIRPHTPLSVDLYITRRCNLNCIYCFADSKYEGNQIGGERCDEMDLDRINCLIDQIAEIGIKKITLTGGESTLRPDLAEIIHRLINYGIEVLLPINGYSMNDKLAHELRDSGIREVQVKLDAANPKTQDRLSRVRGSHKKLIKGIETLKRHSFTITTVAVVTSWNIAEIPDVIRICANLGVSEVNPRIYTPGIWALKGRGGEYLNPSCESILWLEKQIRDLQEKYKGIMKISLLNSSILNKKQESEMPTCPGFVSTCTILENGLVVPCEMVADFSNEFIIGDVRKESLIDIWNSEKAKRWSLRKEFEFLEPCSSCDEFDRCKGGCPWKSFVAYGKWVCDPHCVKSPKPIKIAFSEIPLEKSKL